MLFANISDAKASLSHLIELVGKGEDVVIGKAGKPVARIIPFQEDLRPRKGGQWRGKVEIAEDFDVLPDDILSAFMGSNQ